MDHPRECQRRPDRLSLADYAVADDINITPESAGLNATARGFALLHGEADHDKIRLETPIYDALYTWCQSRVAATTR